MSTENGSFMDMIRKNPVTTGLISFAVLAILIIVIVMMIKTDKKNNTPKPTTKEGFSFSDTFSLSNMTNEDADHIGLGGGYENEENGYDYENEIVENFPQPAPQNVMYSDANGNLATTTDLGVEYLTVTRDSTVSGNLAVKGDSNLKGNVLSRDVFGGGSQLKTETIVAGDGYGGRLHLLGDNVYMMAKNGVRIATDPNSKNPWGASNGSLSVDGDTVVNGNLAISGWGNVKNTLSDFNARLKALEGRAGTLEGKAETLEGRAGTLEGRAGTLEGKMNTIKTVQVFNRVRGGGIWNGIVSDQFTVGTGTKLFNVNFSLYCGGGGTSVTFTFSNGHKCTVDGFINVGSNHQGQSASFVIPNSNLPEGTYTCTLNGGVFDGNDYCFATITTLPN